MPVIGNERVANAIPPNLKDRGSARDHGLSACIRDLSDHTQQTDMKYESSTAVLNAWLQAIEQRDLGKVMSLYHPTAVLLPTFSDLILDTPAKIGRYFERVLDRHGLQIALHEKTFREQSLPPSVSILRGIYTWKFVVEEELITYEARFSFFLDVRESAPILHHHSSQIPRMV